MVNVRDDGDVTQMITTLLQVLEIARYCTRITALLKQDSQHPPQTSIAEPLRSLSRSVKRVACVLLHNVVPNVHIKHYFGAT